MAFELFKKKKELVDFRPKDSDMPIPVKMRDRLLGGRASPSSSISNLIAQAPLSTPSPSSSSGSSSSGGFFSFFGGDSGSSSSSNDSSSSSSPATSFWDAGTNTAPSSSSSGSDKIESSLNDLLYRFSRLMDRVELLEKKMDRFERKDGSSSY